MRASGGTLLRRVALVSAAWLALCAPLAEAGPCDLYGGDGDGDGICDDGSASGLVGDLPCACAPGSPASCLEGCDDNCPWSFNSHQLDTGRVGAPDLPDGIGDDCQCFDVSGDGRGNVGDSSRMQRDLLSLPPALPAPEKCPGSGPSACDSGDVKLLRHILAGDSAAPANMCMAAGNCEASADCPVGTGCDTSAHQCGKYAGQACVQASQCLTAACCSLACRDLASDESNCGSCGSVCSNPHGTTACSGGECYPTSCSTGWGNCDLNGPNGCERSLRTLTDCGACGAPCNLANASESCSTGTCLLASCNSGYSNCDGNESNGCELGHASAPNACASAANLGSLGGDSSCGAFCTSSPGWSTFATASGNRSAWYSARAIENSVCFGTIEHRVTLTVPTGVNYDLYAYSACGTLLASSTAGAGITEQLFASRSKTALDDSFYYWIEVRYVSGASCSTWGLTLAGHNC